MEIKSCCKQDFAVTAISVDEMADYIYDKLHID